LSKVKSTTLVLVGLMTLMIVGLFLYNYKGPTFVLEEQVILEKDSVNNDFIKIRYPELKKDELLVLTGKTSNKATLSTLYNNFDETNDYIGLGLCQSIYATSLKSDSLFSVSGKNIINMPESIKTQDDADFIFGKAKAAFEQSLAINKNNLSANNGLALCYIDYDEQVMKGIGLLKHTLSQDSNNIEAIQYLGYLSIKSNQLEKAIERFKKLVTLQPSNSEHYNNLSQVYMRMGDKHKANLYLEMGKKLSENKK
jgi:tetratricopeptide (TPR) repeat protein